MDKPLFGHGQKWLAPRVELPEFEEENPVIWLKSHFKIVEPHVFDAYAFENLTVEDIDFLNDLYDLPRRGRPGFEVWIGTFHEVNWRFELQYGDKARIEAGCLRGKHLASGARFTSASVSSSLH